MVCSWNCNSRHNCAYVCVCGDTAFFYVCLLALSMRHHRLACRDGSLAWWARLHFETQNWGRGVDKNAEFAQQETKPNLKVLFWCRSGLLIISRNFPPLLLGVEPVSYTKKTLLIRRTEAVSATEIDFSELFFLLVERDVCPGGGCSSTVF